MIGSPPGNIDMSLRLWSDGLSLEPLAARLGFEISHLHLKGAPMAASGPLSTRAAKRHYVSIGSCRGESSLDVSTWLQAVADAVRGQPAIIDDLLRGRIEGVLWVACLRGEPSSRPEISDADIDSVAALGLTILMEDYTARSAAAPTKTWLPARTSLQSLEA